jgi:predicted ATP-dependent endonuclease of OLD family
LTPAHPYEYVAASEETKTMRLSGFKIQNYKGIPLIEITMPKEDPRRWGSADFLSIVGPNNIGKSSILEALMLGLEHDAKPDLDVFPQHKPEKFPIEINMEFDDLTEREKNLKAVSRHIHNGKYRIAKRWKVPGSKPERYGIGVTYNYIGLPNEPLSREEFSQIDGWNDVIVKYEELTGGKYRKSSRILDKLKEVAREHGFPVAQQTGKIDYVADESKDEDWYTEEELKRNPGGFSSNLASALPRIIYVPALKDTSEETDSRKKTSAIRQIVQELFERKFQREFVMARLRRAISEVENLFRGDSKNSMVKSIESQISTRMQQIIDIEAQLVFKPDVLKEICSHLAAGTEFKLQDTRSGLSTNPEHQGHGAQRALLLCLLQVLADVMARDSEISVGNVPHRGLVLLIEEPEIYLHPEMCRKMRDTLLRISQQKHAQVICTTHSPVFLDLADRHDGIVVLRENPQGEFGYLQRTTDLFGEDEDKPEEQQLEKNERQRLKEERQRSLNEERQRLRMLLDFDPSVKEIFFSKRICLVEGDTEIASIEACADRLIQLGLIDRHRYLQERRNVVMVNCRGKWTIPAFQRVLNAFCIPYRVVHDSDTVAAEDEEPEDSNKANERIKSLISDKDVLFVNVPNFENDALNSLIKIRTKKDKPWRATQAIRALATIPPRLLSFFEFVMASSLTDLSVHEQMDERADLELSNERRRRNFRSNIKPIQLIGSAHRGESTLEAAFGISAGPGRLDELDAKISVYHDSKGRELYVVKVIGDSMADTLQDGDQIAIQMLPDTFLEPLQGGDSLPLSSFQSKISDGGIYIVAVNQQIDDKQYTIKRVECFELKSGGWGCKLVADNPDADWGDRGRFYVRKNDRVHFAAEVLGFAFLADREDSVPIAQYDAKVLSRA